MTVSAKVDNALRAGAQLAADEGGEPVKAEAIAHAQGIPPRFLLAAPTAWGGRVCRNRGRLGIVADRGCRPATFGLPPAEA